MTDYAHYDVLVIGGGIHGAGVAQAAAAAGYSVLVLEQGEVASGTSSRSSKLIHGGLRYLEHGQYSLVRECLRERSLLLKLAPDLVQLRPFFIPVYADSSRNRFVIRIGLMLYSLLGGLGVDTRFRRVPRREWSSLGGLKMENLRAVFQYWDAQTDDVQLTRAVMASARKLGVKLLTRTEFCAAKSVVNARAGDSHTLDSQSADSQIIDSKSNERWEVRYRRADQNTEHRCTASAIVNAAGPWVNAVLARLQPPVVPLDVTLVQGTHLVLEAELSHGIYYLESPRDKRPIFVMPWQISQQPDAANTQPEIRSAILLGTTETAFSGDPATVRPLPEEQEYLLETYRHYFMRAGSSDNIKPLAAFAGLRVLPGDADSASIAHASRPRDTVLQPDRMDRPRLVSVYGGKLTTYRSTAQKVLNMLVKGLPDCSPVADTACLPLERVMDGESKIP
jgi:glycerol-3-phosphate dehydrogenase